MSDNWTDGPIMLAAAMEGIAENVAFPLSDRLGAAKQVYELLHKRIDGRERWRKAVLDLCEDVAKYDPRLASEVAAEIRDLPLEES
jgi:hypothetical protein